LKAVLLADRPAFHRDREDERFHRIFWVTFILYSLLGVGVSLLHVEPVIREEVTQLPPRIAELIIKPKPLPKPEVKPSEPTAEIEELEPEIVEPPPPTPEEIAEEQRRRDMEVALNSGLLSILKQSKTKPISDDKQKKYSEIKSLSRRPEPLQQGIAMKGAQASSGIDDLVSQLEEALKDSKAIGPDNTLVISGGISAPNTAPTGGGTLKGRKTTAVKSPFRIKGYADGKSPRTYEEISEVVEGYKGMISLLYNKALRNDPTLRGTVTVEFTIAAIGDILECKVTDSSAEDPPFEESLCKRIMGWKFPSVPEGDVTVVYPLVFYATG
jgi:periplasmic protein TonB